jgi:hypothetical protein
LVVSDFSFSWVVDVLELSLLGGVEVAPLPAEPFVVLEELLGLVLEAPPPAWSFFCMSDEVADEELDGGVALDGLVEVLEPAEDEPDGEVDGVVVVLDEEPVAARSLPARSQAVSRVAPSAMETAMAIVDSLMRPPWVGLLRG